MQYTEKIQAIVDEALTEKTFSLEIITKIKELKDDFDVVVEINKKLEEEVTFFKGANRTLTTENTALITKNNDYHKREVELAQGEREAEKKVYELTYQTNRANEIKELFQIVFRNPVVQESVLKNGQAPSSNGSTVYTNENITSSKTIN